MLTRGRSSFFPCSRSLRPALRRRRPLRPKARAVAFLAQEVPRWRREHPCYSCHNNGDAARALIAAASRGFDVRAPLADSLSGCGDRPRWNGERPWGGLDDRPLMRIQFAGALTSAVEGGLAPPDRLGDGRRTHCARPGRGRLVAARLVAEPGLAGHLWHRARHLVGAPDVGAARNTGAAARIATGRCVASTARRSRRCHRCGGDRARSGARRRQRGACATRALPRPPSARRGAQGRLGPVCHGRAGTLRYGRCAPRRSQCWRNRRVATEPVFSE